jgi:ATP-dependent Clp protease ATP-binding subunit ClpC
MFERFTDRARKVMALANQEAQRFNHEYIGTEHVLLGLVKEGSGVGANVLKNLDVDLRKVRLEVEKLVKSGPEMVTMGKLPQTPRAKKVIEYAIEEARNLNHNYVGTEHLLLGLLREQDGVAAQVLMNLGLKLDEVREEVLNLLGAGGARRVRRACRRGTERARHAGRHPAQERHQEQDARAGLLRP